jgi:hypothetical protein
VAHLNEHSEQLNAQLDPLVDEINALGARLSTFDIQKKTANCREKLEQWRVDCHEKIDLFFEEKCQEPKKSTNNGKKLHVCSWY